MTIIRRIDRLTSKGSRQQRGPLLVCEWSAAAWVIALLTAPAASAQDSGQTAPIVVMAPRTVFGVEPERTLGEDDVSGYGLATIGELLDEVAAESGDSSDAPEFVVNGQRVASLSDIDTLPAEAIESVDILPAGSGPRIGASATRRVYSITLKRELDTLAVRGSLRAATEGGWLSTRADAGYTRLRGVRRINLTGAIRYEPDLLESERDVLQPASAIAQAGRYRTLRPEVRQFDLGLRAADQLSPWLRGSLSATYRDARRNALLGPYSAPQLVARRQRGDSRTFDSELSLEARAGEWVVNLFGTLRDDRLVTTTQRSDPTGGGLADAVTRSVTRNAAALLTASGPAFDLPAGPVRLTFGAGVSRDTISGARIFGGTTTASRYAQTTSSYSAAVAVPIANRERGFLPFLGELTGTAELRVAGTGQYGTLTSRTFSLVWQPSSRLRLQGAIESGRTPPAVGLVAAPLLETPGVRYYDPLLAETVDVTQTTGGLAGIGDQRAASRLFSATWKPPLVRGNLQLTAEYRGIDNRDVITTLPQATAAILAAYPERFLRDPAGRLVAVDARPVVFARQNQDQLRLGANLTVPLRRQSSASADKSAVPRLQFNASYTRLLDSEILLTPGTAPIDLLSTEAISLAGVTRPRHQLDLTAGYSERGLGFRLSAQVGGESFLSISNATRQDRLRFAPFATVSARAFVEGSRLFGTSPFAKGTRLSLTVSNITNARQRVTDQAGQTPLAFQPAYRDPLGRTVGLELRRAF